MNATADTTLRRKLGGGRVGRSPIPDVESIGENFAQLLDDRLRHLVRTITSSIVLECEVRKLSRVLEGVQVPAMLGMVHVEGARDMALMNISNDLLFHIVDLRMGGDPADAPAPFARAITGVDCALCAGFVELSTAAFEKALTAALGVKGREAMKLDRFEQHPAMTRIAPENADVLVLELSLDLGEAARSGECQLIVPLSVLDAYKATGDRDAEVRSDTAEAQSLWAQRMTQVAAEAPVHLVSVLHQAEMRLDELEDLQVGDVLPLPESCRGEVRLRIGGAKGAAIVSGRLGAQDGKKAVKLASGPDPLLTAQLRQMIERDFS